MSVEVKNMGYSRREVAGTVPDVQSRAQRLIRYASLSLLVFLFNACAGRQSALDPAGPQAHRLSRLWWFVFSVCTAVFVIVMAALILAIVRGRGNRRHNNDPMLPEVRPEPERERRVTRVIAGAMALTVLLLFIILIFDFFTARRMLAFTNAPEPLTIVVTGHQWWWEVQYDDPAPSNVVRTANEIHIPAGQPVKLKLTSTDVIHSFWVPNLQGKKDLIPGQQTISWLQADRPGTYRGQCAEFCGFEHAKMAMFVIVQSPEEFNAWLDSQRQPAQQPATDEQKRGQQVFLSATCVMCHTVRGTDAGSNYGPDLTHLASRQTIASGMLPNTRGHLGGWIADSQEIKPGNHMPPNPLKPDDLQTLLSYLESLQ